MVLSIIASSSALSSTEGTGGGTSLGDKDPDLYDIMDGWREGKLEDKEKEYEKQGMSKEQAAQKIKEDQLIAQKELENQETFLFVVPFVAYNPYSDWLFGVGANISTYLGNKNTTKLSSFNVVGAYTLNEQMSLRLINQAYTEDNKYFITGYAQWSDAPGPAYGIGGNTPEEQKFEIERGFFKINQSFLFNIGTNWFLGPQVTIDRRYKLKPDEDAPDDMTSEEYEQLLNDVWYSYEYGTSGSDYNVYGIGVTALLDSRDNVNSPYKGQYFNGNYQYFTGDYEFHLLNVEYRKYFQVPDKRNILGLWLLSTFTKGETPFDSLPANGLDPLYASSRGYVARRYMGEQYLYLETEYRRNIYKWFGMTGFLNAHSVTEQDTGEFKYVNPGMG